MMGVIRIAMKDDQLRKTFGMRLRQLRMQKKWSQKELSQKIEVKLSIFTKYEMGLHLPAPEKLIELSELFHTTVDYLLTGNQTESHSLHNRRLLDRFKALENFQNDDQETVIKLIDAFIKKQQIETVLNR